jgi:simple sugar transport system substrate-binding protein
VENDFFGAVKKGMSDAAEQVGVACEFTGSIGPDMSSQAEKVRGAIAERVDGIALNIMDSAILAPLVKEASTAGIPVVAFNVDDQQTPTGRLSAVCQNLREAGRVLGREAASFVSPGDAVFLLMHDEGIAALEERRRGIMNGLADKDVDWNVLIAGDKEKTVQVVTDALEQSPDVNVILCTGQSDTEGAGLAVERNFSGRGARVAGFDLSPDTLRMIAEGTIRFAIDQQPYAQGYYPVIQLAQYCRYGIAPSDVDAGADVIDREKAERLIEWSKQGYR